MWNNSNCGNNGKFSSNGAADFDQRSARGQEFLRTSNQTSMSTSSSSYSLSPSSPMGEFPMRGGSGGGRHNMQLPSPDSPLGTTKRQARMNSSFISHTFFSRLTIAFAFVILCFLFDNKIPLPNVSYR